MKIINIIYIVKIIHFFNKDYYIQKHIVSIFNIDNNIFVNSLNKKLII